MWVDRTYDFIKQANQPTFFLQNWLGNREVMRTPENMSWYGVGGIRTHGALADTLVFKNRLFLVIPVNLNRYKVIKLPKVIHFYELSCS